MSQTAILKRISLIILCLILGCLAKDARATEHSSKIRAAYWGISDPEQAAEQIRRVKQAGFTTALVRDNRYEIDAPVWQRWAQVADSSGLALYPVIHLAVPGWFKQYSEMYRPYVNRFGFTYEATPCPVDRLYWHMVIGRRFVQFARLSAGHAIAGAVFDSEMYGSDFSIYSDPCFCDTCWQNFVNARQANSPGLQSARDLPRSRRFEALAQRGMVDDYSIYQQERLQEILRPIERHIHRISARFSLGFLGYRRNWFYHGLIHGLGTPEVPVKVFSESTYVRGTTPSVRQEKTSILAQQDGNAPLALYIPGIWLERFFPDDLPSQLSSLAAQTDGVWIYSAESLWNAGPSRLHGTREAYWERLRWANDHIDACEERSDFCEDDDRRFAPSFYDTSQQRLCRNSALVPFLQAVAAWQDARTWSATDVPGRLYREKTLFHLLPGHAQGMITIEHVAVGEYEDYTTYKLFDAEGRLIRQGVLNRQHPSDRLTLRSPMTGVLSLLTDPGTAAVKVTIAALPYVLEASTMFPLTTAEGAAYHVSLPPEEPRLKLRVYCPDCPHSQTGELLLWNPALRRRFYSRLRDFTEVATTFLHPSPHSEHTASVADETSPSFLSNIQNLGVLRIQNFPASTSSRLRVYLYGTLVPYLIPQEIMPEN